MNRSEKPDSTSKPSDEVNETLHSKQDNDSKSTLVPSFAQSRNSDFDWTVLGVVILISAFFALTARLHTQPATSFVPIAVLSATGCGLLVTAFRKLRTNKGIGLREAALGGFFMSVIQCIIALTYPGVFNFISPSQIIRNDFLITWLLIIGFSIIFCIVGATLGHLSFAPFRPVPIRSSSTQSVDDKNLFTIPNEQSERYTERDSTLTKIVLANDEVDDTAKTSNQKIQIEDTSALSFSNESQRTITSYIIILLLLGLTPTVVAYLFSAAYDFILSINQFVPGPYPTLRLLSALLPWQIPIPIDLNGNLSDTIIFSLLWRIPLFLGNPSIFDLQALEPYVYNGAAFALLLLTTYRQNSKTSNRSSQPGFLTFLFMEAALGLIIILPANIWVLRGLQGLLQFHGIVIPIRTISILNPLTFLLNLITGALVCVGLGIVLRIVLSKRTV